MIKKIVIVVIGIVFLLFLFHKYLNSGPKGAVNTVWSTHIGRDTTVGILPDQYANYYSYTAVRTSQDIGFVIKGAYPDTRYFSVNVYSLGDNTTQGSIIDYQIQPDEDLPNPYTTDKDSIPTGENFTIHIIPTTYASGQFSNSLAFKDDTRLISIVLRVYDYNIDDFGGVDLPTVEAIALNKQQENIAWSERRLPKPISLRTIVRNVSLPGMVERLGELYLTEKQTALDQYDNNQPVGIPFHAINTDGYIANNDNRYLLAAITKQEDELYYFKFKAPTHTRNYSEMNKTEVRYWSFNLGNAATYNFNALKDEDAIIDEDGYVHIVLSSEHDDILNKTQELGFNHMEWNMPWSKALILFRHMLADPTFVAQIDAVPPISKDMEDFNPVEAQKYMGDYAPVGLRMSHQDFLTNY